MVEYKVKWLSHQPGELTGRLDCPQIRLVAVDEHLPTISNVNGLVIMFDHPTALKYIKYIDTHHGATFQ